MKIAASIWEEHCTECAMPECYGTCPVFERGWHSRCVRVDGFAESLHGCGRFAFRRWGKIELKWHGRVVSPALARVLGWLNTALVPLWRMMGFAHRAVRWRLVASAGSAAVLDSWHLRLVAAKREHLTARIVTGEGREVFCSPLELKPGTEMRFFFSPPYVPPGSLLQIFPTDGSPTGYISFLENSAGFSGDVKRVKCLVWDLDGTLWDGTLSEGGPCRPVDASVRLLKELESRGIVNSIASRNDESEAMEELRRHSLDGYFVFPEISWGEKSAAVKRIAANLGFALDAVAFVDDRPEQRAEVAANAPGVRVYDVADIPRLSRDPAFKAGGKGGSRTAFYKDEMKRRAALKDVYAGDEARFLESSGIEVEISPFRADDFERVFELVNRTNLLNISSRRYTRAELEGFLAAAGRFTVRVKDRYGDYGLVGFAALDSCRVTELCFSCRIAGKGVERRVLEKLSGGRRLEAPHAAANGRNQALLDLLDEFTSGGRCAHAEEGV